ncbi:hypothetical protein [Streptomyces sp. NPDC048142]|uniref:hypothetical protein n=1 Tax=Streptomyces sp. NPDC048142 TaxID=3365501 RepID=UPI00372466F7
MTRTLSAPPATASGCLAGSPQPVLPGADDDALLLRPWERADEAAFLHARGQR